MKELLGIIEDLRAPRIQGFTLKDIQPAPRRPLPRYADPSIKPLLLPLQSKQTVLWRLAEKHYVHWHKASLPIFEDDYFVYRILRDLEGSERPLDLPRIYAVLARRFGPGSSHKDDWKEAFKFPLLIELERLGTTILYSLTVAQWKSSIEIRFRRQHIGVEHLDRDVYHEPFDAELSRPELNRCAAFILELCSLVYHDAPKAFVFDFHFAVPAAHVIFGCWKGKFYERQFEDEVDFYKHSVRPG
jgi:hypothetical protein